MLEFKLSKAVKRIVIPQQATAEGPSAGVYVLKPKKKRKKLSKSSRFLEKLLRHGATAQRKGVNTYLERHKRSNRKKKDGWLRDLSNNLSRASNKGRKRFKLSKLF
ncbi:DUF6312 domain-containing protein [Chondromyces apiculatus]|uniref:Uncharacterized protein n=1 Tax=Chondromyces apiculatus DSM 436 TaxID=1192034 RepID=A0A017SW97_9BACT|nr:hypothetical protein [Chondromyces apiculatus]EYF00546.1 Hypothetical protein CAP_0475 [Chondromyces apiculatus DSM 436]